MSGEPDEVAEAYLYLMQQTYITGQVLIVDGGGTLA
jgi:NAD(P)-dependent dehydrogenase (short-subunit alcohol dehydrogenase family)